MNVEIGTEAPIFLFWVSNFRHFVFAVRDASKIKLKKENNKRTVKVRRVIIFLKYFKASIFTLITLLSSSVQNSEGVGDNIR